MPQESVLFRSGRNLKSHDSRAWVKSAQTIQAIHRQGNAPEQSRIRAEARSRADPEFLHGQEHARAERLHHGTAGSAGGGVKCPLPNNR